MALGERATGRVEPVRNREWLVHFPWVESQLCSDVAAIYQRSSFHKASDVYREWLVHVPRVESQLCACLEPRLGRKLAEAELVALMQIVSCDYFGAPPSGRNPASGAWLGAEAKEMPPFLGSSQTTRKSQETSAV